MPRMTIWQTQNRTYCQETEEKKAWERLGVDKEGRLLLTYERVISMFPGLVSNDHATSREDDETD